MSSHYQNLSAEERAVIMIERQNGSSLRKIALQLGRSSSTVSRELRRGGATVYNAADAARVLWLG
jgi:IS30 family transposase